MLQEKRSIPNSVSKEDWRDTPDSVRELVFSLIERVEKLEEKVRDLEESQKKTSKNSSNPPSSDGPAFPPNPKKKKGKRKKGGQPGHKGVTRKLVALEDVDESYDLKPETCGKCGDGLSGEDAFPDRHQVTEIPPLIATVTEYR